MHRRQCLSGGWRRRPNLSGGWRFTATIAGLVLAIAAPIWVNPHRAQAGEPVGWRPRFSQVFDGGKVPMGCIPYDGPHRESSASYFRPDDVKVAGGYLHLSVRRRAYAGREYTSGGLRCDVTQQYGRYEVRARAPIGAGLDPVITLTPESGGADRQGSVVGVLTNPGQERLYVVNEYGAGTTNRSVAGNYGGEFHTYVIEWAPSGFRLLVDNEERLVDAHVSTEPRWLGFSVTGNDALAGAPTSATELPAEFVLDYVRVWSYDPAASAVATPSTLAVQPAVRSRLGGWLFGAGSVAGIGALVCLAVVLFRRRIPRRPRSSHRA